MQPAGTNEVPRFFYIVIFNLEITKTGHIFSHLIWFLISSLIQVKSGPPILILTNEWSKKTPAITLLFLSQWAAAEANSSFQAILVKGKYS